MSDEPEEKKVNGHRPVGLLHLLHPALKAAKLVPLKDVPFDVDALARSVVKVETEAVPNAITAQTLGNRREGNGMVIGDELVLTIGYVILEAGTVMLTSADGRKFAGDVIGYDYESGFGLLRAPGVKAPALPRGDSSAVNERDPLVAIGAGGREFIVSTLLVSRRPFAGSWEYMLEEAFFTSPPHPAWSGAGLFDFSGKMVGLGSLFVNDALPGSNALPGNMFIPIALLEDALPFMMGGGRLRPPRPWLGMFTVETMGHLIVTGVMTRGPADTAGVAAGDILVRVAGERVRTLRDLYRRVWSLGAAGVDVPVTFVRDGNARQTVLKSIDRNRYFRLPNTH